jgi:two-component SAPR family response regulator
MRRIALCFAAVLLIQINGFCQSYGLTFGSHETVLEKRTSLDISPDDSICFSKNFELGFDINYLPNHHTYFGYILRIISNGNNNIDLIYHQKSHTFRVTSGESFSDINFTIDSPRLYQDWNRIVLKFNLENQTLAFEVNSKKAGTCNIPLNFRCFKFLWGANDYQKYKTRDIPPMQIKDIRIYENNSLKHYWPLNELSGTTSMDSVTKQTAKIKNPIWIRPKYQKWELASTFTLGGYAGVAFDPKTDKIYISGSDSLAVFEINTEKGLVEWIPGKHENLRVGHQTIFDSSSGRLVDFFIDQKKVVPYNFSNNRWESDFEDGKITEFWHANKFISYPDSSLYVIGGYGQLRYKSMVQRYSFLTKKWDTLKTSGDTSPPRYLSALGRDPGGKYVYIVGGYGSQTGDQMLDPHNFYDMFRYNIPEKSFKKLYTLKPVQNQFTFANSLVIDPKTNNYYGLIYPNDSSSSNLQLIKGSLNDSSFQLLGNAIPFMFHDIESFVDLYYSPISNKLVTVVLNYSRSDETEKKTTVKIYSVNFVPEPMEIVRGDDGTEGHRTILWISIGLGLLVLLGLYAIRRKKRFGIVPAGALQSISGMEPHTINGLSVFQNSGEKEIHSSIFLFGQFQVFDKDGHDISGLFTPLLKELFLVVCINTIRQGRGITSEMLNERLWHDKSEKDAKNNRSVNIAKLKTILEKVGNCTINKEAGSWQFQVMDDHIYIDFRNFYSIIQHHQHPSKEDVRHLIDIIKRGSFLYLTEYDWLDNIKSEISNAVIDFCVRYIKEHGISHEPDFIIEITNCIFHFDHLNEEALAYQCKSLINLKRLTLANNIYLKYAKEYKDIYGAEFTKSFNETISG